MQVADESGLRPEHEYLRCEQAHRRLSDRPDEVGIVLANQYMLMATGDYNGDGVGDVAVSGVFPNLGNGSVNSKNALAVPVEIYLGNGMGGLNKDTNCIIPKTEKPVQLLTIPGTKDDLLVATFEGGVYRCSRSNSTWTPSLVSVGNMLSDGFKQLVPVTDATTPTTSADLAVRISKNLFPYDDPTTGSLEVRRGNGPFSFGGLTTTVSTSNVSCVLPYKFSNDNFDTLATTWDASGGHPGIEFYVVNKDNSVSRMTNMSTASGNVSGTKFVELNNVAYGTVVPFRIAGQSTPGILFGYSQKPNLLSVFTGNMVSTLVLAGQKNLTATGPTGLMVVYAGDANGDNQDEVGFYTMSPNSKTPVDNHLQLFIYKSATIGSSIYDSILSGENFRGMALATLNGSKDAKRKDLIALIENPATGTSRLIVRRANLNFTAF